MSKHLKGMGGAEFIAHMRVERNDQVLSHLSAALAKAAVRGDLPDIKALLRENRGKFWGPTELPSALARLERHAGIPLLIELLQDHPAGAHQAAKALLRLKAAGAAPHIRSWAAGCDAVWRDEARAVTRKLKERGWA